MTNAEKYRKLRTWARHIERNVPRERFDMEVWWREREDCGIAGCAGGHAVDCFPDELEREFEEGSDVLYEIHHIDIGSCGESAIIDVFEISDEDANWICHPNRYRSGLIPKSAVVARIRKVAERYKDMPDA